MDRRHELENLRRSIAMLTPGVNALSREQALDLLGDLEEVGSRLDRLRSGLSALLAEDQASQLLAPSDLPAVSGQDGGGGRGRPARPSTWP